MKQQTIIDYTNQLVTAITNDNLNEAVSLLCDVERYPECKRIRDGLKLLNGACELLDSQRLEALENDEPEKANLIGILLDMAQQNIAILKQPLTHQFKA
ncbi:hypothetical protein [Enterovibrio norvegicus]|uniref:hypothetical protein n=1 Tax=Enterovibrio norvegicus TaxID=188144 RepID=UPI000C85A655|nr:hypothetical protein [Enterovibrio norvegicus]PMN64313.1 hypothetical protein BCT27_10130 [Enterovibrio norvegicus]